MQILAELNLDLLKPSEPSIFIQHHLLPSDVDYITYLHVVLYTLEQGWDYTFDSYVAIPLAQFAMRDGPKKCILIVKKEGGIAGSEDPFNSIPSKSQITDLQISSDVPDCKSILQLRLITMSSMEEIDILQSWNAVPLGCASGTAPPSCDAVF